MKSLTRITTLILGLSMIFLFSCKKENDPQNNPISEAVLNPITKIITAASNAELTAIDSTKLVFQGSNNQVLYINIGDIMVSDMCVQAPDGYLRKVIDIQKNGTQTTFITENASLSEAIKDGEVSFSKEITVTDVIGIDSTDITIEKSAAGNGNFSFHFKKTLYDEDNSTHTIEDQMTLEGNIDFKPTLDFNCKIANYSLTNFLLKATIENNVSLNLTSKIKVPNLKTEQPIAVFRLAPFTILIGALPVPIAKQWIVLVIGIDGELSAKLVQEVSNTYTAELGLNYSSGQWNSISNSVNKFDLKPFELEGKSSIEPWLQLRYELRPYGLSSSKIFLAARASAKAEIILNSQALSWKAQWGLKFFAKAQVKVLSKIIADYEYEFYSNYWTIKEGSVPFDLDFGLVAFYPFNGNPMDESGNQNNGTVNGNVELTTGRKNESNGAYSFSGEPFNYIEIPHNSNLNLDDFTLNAWVYTDSDFANGYILNKGRDIVNGTYRLGVNFVGATVQYGSTNGAGISQIPSINTWHMITGVVSGNNAKLYVDGVLAKEETLASNFTCTDSSPLTIGMHYYPGVPSSWAYPYKGKLDDIKIYNRPISENEIQLLFAQ
jgi:hypothetical protein